ncbi:hypothetical protein ACFLVO_03985 [Chloroflexota bacterium]
MKGLIQTIIIIAALIGAGFVTSILITRYFINREAAAHEQGFEEGRTQGYEAGFCEGAIDGYQAGSVIGYEMSQGKDISDFGEGFYFNYNPTYDEVQEVLAEHNKTTAMEINNCAEANGIRTAYVRCQIARKSAEETVFIYNLVAFETIDRGLIFVRPQSHEEVKVEVGKSYSRLNGFPSPPYDDTITKMTIFW